jgi:tRNA threonylcarbamoyladenosine biosynthesis protein TsaE
VKTELIPLVCEKTIICLNGEMGAGKTEIVKVVCAQMGLEQAQSPTFGLANLYHNQNSNLSFYHVDLYRIHSLEDLESTGFWDLLSENHSVLFVEWAQLISEESWPWDWKRVQIDVEKRDLEERVIKLRFQ